MIKAVIFDMDGTLIDTEKYYRVCWKAALAEFGFQMTDEQALAMRSLGRPFAPVRLKEWFGQALDYKAVRERRKEMMEECLERDGIRCKPGVHELLSYLKERGIVAGVATATDLGRPKRDRTKVGLIQCFDRLVSAAMVREGKPSPDIYRFACEQLGEKPSFCAAVEDSPNGVLSAYRAGCPVIMVPDQTEPDEALSRCLWARVDTLADIRGVLEGNRLAEG